MTVCVSRSSKISIESAYHRQTLSHVLDINNIIEPKVGLGAGDDNASADGRKISSTLGGCVNVTKISLTFQPLPHLLHLVVPVGPSDNKATNDTGGHQSDRETNPETPKFHILLKGEVDARWNTKDVIGANNGGHQMSFEMRIWRELTQG